tara:strand:- start:450 stop:689 length:240 start_codon:yes stop_codon:yes gene_type:complete
MKMFDIVKFCNNEKQCNNHYSKNITAGNDPSITRKQRFSQIVRTNKMHTIRNFKLAEAPPKPFVESHQYPKGQIFTLPR